MTSNGGMLAASVTCEKPVLVVASGPAGGVIGAARLGIARNDRDVIVFDMGGTTAKAVIIEDGRPTMTSEYEFRDGISTSSRFIKAGGYMLKCRRSISRRSAPAGARWPASTRAVCWWSGRNPPARCRDRRAMASAIKGDRDRRQCVLGFINDTRWPAASSTSTAP